MPRTSSATHKPDWQRPESRPAPSWNRPHLQSDFNRHRTVGGEAAESLSARGLCWFAAAVDGARADGADPDGAYGGPEAELEEEEPESIRDDNWDSGHLGRLVTALAAAVPSAPATPPYPDDSHFQ